jgi:hypothetical protein
MMNSAATRVSWMPSGVIVRTGPRAVFSRHAATTLHSAKKITPKYMTICNTMPG